MSKRFWALAFFALLLCSAGCIENKSPDEYGYALVIGIDEGEEKPYYISMLLQRGNGNTENSQGEVCAYAAVECANFFEGIDLLESTLPYSLNLSRATALIISEQAARAGLLEDFLSVSLSTLQIRYYANLVVAHSRADDYVRGLQSEMNPNVAKLQYTFVEYGEITGLAPSVTLAEFYDRAWSGAGSGDVMMPLGAFTPQDESEDEQQPTIPKEEKQKSQQQEPAVDILGDSMFLPGSINKEGGLESGMMGSAIFYDRHVVGLLNGPHTLLVMMANGQFEHGRIQLAIGDEQSVSVSLTARKAPRVKLELGEKSSAHFAISLSALVERPEAVAHLSEQEVEDYISAYLERELLRVYEACKQQKSDVFALGKHAVVQFESVEQWEAYDWKSAYENTSVSFSVDVALEYNPTRSRLE
ncbi:hypothetical protein LJC42_00615 [Eubacteriales bacterium OttesenSCG-928-K08]|nr:hypothetical protein [Eubacteriales bacterium OttesenSCG-928-K08]